MEEESVLNLARKISDKKAKGLLEENKLKVRKKVEPDSVLIEAKRIEIEKNIKKRK